MASRRMFHADIVESDSFLGMSFEAQLLYFHLCMYADEDGFINSPRRITRSIGVQEDSLQTLIDKRFLLEFPDGVLVVKHWRMANTLKNDRVQPPRYPELAAIIYLKTNNTYTLNANEGGKTLLADKLEKMEAKGNKINSKWNPNGNLAEQSKAENSRTEHIAEAEALDSAAAAADRQLRLFNGTLGKGVVLLSNDQIASLLEKLDVDAFDYYVERLADYIISKEAKPKNHYQTILKWYDEDSAIKP